MVGAAYLIRADARRIPLADETVDLIVTSPPYFGLRDYGTAGQIGSEPHWRDFLDALVECTAEMVRVLKPSGSIFVNLGDKYSANPSSNGGGTTLNGGRAAPIYQTGHGNGLPGARPKSLLLLPERYRIACVDTLGLIARAVIIWDKPNGLPESVRDRVRRSHEDWVHLTKSPRYYSAVDEIREATGDDRRPGKSGRWFDGIPEIAYGNGPTSTDTKGRLNQFSNPLGKLPGSVWTIPSEPLQAPAHLGIDHYAAFPTEWPRRLILGWSPPAICEVCNQGRWPVVESTITAARVELPSTPSSGNVGVLGKERAATILGYACACTPFTDHPERRQPTVTPGRMLGRGPGVQQHREDLGYTRHHGDDWPQRQPTRDYHLTGWTPPPSHPAVVLDPFGGTGTTVMVARALDRIGIGIDLSADYLRLATWRIWHSGAAGKAISRTNLERQGALL